MDAGVEMMQQTADMMETESEDEDIEAEAQEPMMMMEEQEEETMPQEPRGLMAKG